MSTFVLKSEDVLASKYWCILKFKDGNVSVPRSKDVLKSAVGLDLVTKGYSSYKPHPNFGVLIQCFVMGSPQRSTSQAIFNSCNGRNISCTPMHTSKTSTCNGQTLKKRTTNILIHIFIDLKKSIWHQLVTHGLQINSNSLARYGAGYIIHLIKQKQKQMSILM